MEILIRRSEPTDASAIAEIYASPNAYHGTLQLPHSPIQQWEQRLAKNSENLYSYVAERDGEIVGNLGLIVDSNPRRRHVATIGLALKDAVSGQGIGSKLLSTAIDLADSWLNLKRIEMTVFVDNKPAVKLYEKFGFEIEGQSACYAFRNGEYVSAYHMGRVSNNVAAIISPA